MNPLCQQVLERRGHGLSVKDVFGLVSFLKEQRNCKVVLLLNDEEIKEGDKEEYSAHLEKVVDVLAVLAPTAEDSTRIALAKGDAIDEALKSRCVKLDISNIRVIKRIERYVRLVASHLQGTFDEQVLNQAVHTIVLLGWSKFQPSIAPSIEYLKGRLEAATNFEDEQEPSPQRTTWDALLERYEFVWLDEFDSELLNILVRGFVDPETLAKRARALHQTIQNSKGKKSIEDAWRLYHDTFDDNAEEVLNTMRASFKSGIPSLTIGNLNATVVLFRDLGRGADADQLIKEFIEGRDEGPDFWDLEEYAWPEEVTDASLRAAFARSR